MTKIHCFGTMALLPHRIIGLLLLFLHPEFLIHSSSFTIPDLWYIISQHHPSLILTTCCWKSILVPHISGRAQGYSRMAGSVGCPWANGAMCACFHWRCSDAQTNMKQCRGRCWATFLAICPLFGMVIDYPYILVWSGSMSKKTRVKPNLFRSRDGKYHIDPIRNRMERSSWVHKFALLFCANTK